MDSEHHVFIVVLFRGNLLFLIDRGEAGQKSSENLRTRTETFDTFYRYTIKNTSKMELPVWKFFNVSEKDILNLQFATSVLEFLTS